MNAPTLITVSSGPDPQPDSNKDFSKGNSKSAIALPFEYTNVVSMPVDALALVPQTTSITRIGRLAYNSMMYLAQSMEADAEGMFSAPLNRILRGFGSDNRHSTELKRHLRSMLGNVVEWQSSTVGESEWGACALLAECRITKKNGENWLAWAYPPTIRAQVMDPPRWAQVSMLSAGQLRTHAAVVLYGICARYKDNIGGLTAKQPWAWWVPVLTGSPAGRVLKTEYRFFKRDYLRPAIEDINEVTEIEVEVKEIKNGRSIEALQFLVKKKPLSALLKSKSPSDVSQYLRATSLGVGGKEAEDLSLKYGETALANALNRMEKRLNQPELSGVGDRHAYLVSILKDLTTPKPPKEKGSSSVTSAASKFNEQSFVQVSQALAGAIGIPGPQGVAFVSPEIQAARKSQEANDRLKEVRLKLEEMTEDERNVLLDELHATFEETVVTRRLLARIKDREWRSPQVLAELLKYYEARRNVNSVET